MSEFGLFDFIFDDSRSRRHQEYLERQARREQRHQEYLERQARRERRHQEYLERQARREANRAAYFARITNNVQRFREQYEKILNNIRQQGLESFIQEDFRSISEKVRQLNQLLALDDVEAARDLSFEIGQSIHGLIPRARRARQQQGLNDSEIKRQARQDFIEQMRKNLELDKEDNPAAVQDAINKLDDLRCRTESMSDTELQDELMTESDKVDGAIADETVRREVIKAIYLTLKKTGFIVNDPQLTDNVVLLRARKPAGQQAVFKVELDGSLAFKFDNYEGQKCKKDIDEVTALLEDCYGVKLSNRRVLWSNPDRIQKGSKDNPAGGGKEQSSN